MSASIPSTSPLFRSRSGVAAIISVAFSLGASFAFKSVPENREAAE